MIGRMYLVFIMTSAACFVTGCRHYSTMRGTDIYTEGAGQRGDIAVEETGDMTGILTVRGDSWGFSDGCEAVIQTDASTVTIRANAESCPLENDVFQAHIVFKEYNLADMINRLTGDEIRGNTQNILEKEPDGKSVKLLNKSREILAEAEILDGGIFSYVNNVLDKQYSEKSMTETAVDDPEILSSEKECLIRCLEIDPSEVEVISSRIFSDEAGHIYHDILFMPTFHGLPLESLPGSDFNPVEDIFGRLDVTDEGVIELTGNFYINFEEESRPKELLSENELLTVLEEHIRMGRVLLPEEVEVNRIKFCYVPINGEKNIEVRPVWRLWFEDLGRPDGVETWISEMGLDAVSGKLLFVY